MLQRLTILLLAFGALCQAAAQQSPAPAAQQAVAERSIVVLGDSLSSGYGLAGEPSWVAMLQDRLRNEGYGYRVVNASIAGDTSSGGLARLPLMLRRHSPAVVVIEIGGNDGLRGQPVQVLRDNISMMIELAQQAGAKVVLGGMQIPPNFGTSYTQALAAVYPDVAKQYGVALIPFLLDGIALHPELMQGDHIHPNAAGQKILLANVWPVLSGLLSR